MAVEHAGTRVVRKPWGCTDLRPWSEICDDGAAIGELWFQRADRDAPDPALLLKLLFTQAPLSIQVHPDDAFAQSIGLAHGKSEAWCILSAARGAGIGVGLKRQLTSRQLRTAIEDGSIADLLHWHPALKGDVVFVPAGTIHAIGAGLVVAEIQQRSDATFRLFDHGRQRALDVDNAVAAAHAGPVERQTAPRRLSAARTLLVACPHFVFERIELAPNSTWKLDAEHETWLLVLEGRARVELMHLFAGEAIFLQANHASIRVAAGGLKALLAYVGTDPTQHLLRNLDLRQSGSPANSMEAQP